jgi:hypothetical protein
MSQSGRAREAGGSADSHCLSEQSLVGHAAKQARPDAFTSPALGDHGRSDTAIRCTALIRRAGHAAAVGLRAGRLQAGDRRRSAPGDLLLRQVRAP